ncbi:MAG: class I SAM-dependent methyltransferase [Pyrinomonadaceae bacterium]
MPGHETLAQMYGEEYGKHFAGDPNGEDVRESLRVIEWLRRSEPGTFIDYGCGAGQLLKEAAKLNWSTAGVEFDERVAEEVRKRTGAVVVTRPGELLNGPLADVLHVGDVIEHLTEINRQMREIVGLIKPGGLLLAQGPLEGNANLFTSMLRLSRTARRRRRTEMAPYHVLLATAAGQRMLFQRFGLEEVEYSVREVSWPAPSKLSLTELGRPRSVGLFILRRCSQAVSTLRPGRWGNRYFYVGRRNG